MTFLLRKSYTHKCYSCLKCCVSFQIEDPLNKHSELCNNTGRKTIRRDDYLRFDKFYYKNSVPFAMYCDFDCIIKDSNTSNKNKKHLPIACCLYIKNDYPDVLEDEYECFCGEGVVDWLISRMIYYKKLYKDIFSINIPLKEDSVPPLNNMCYFCNEYIDNGIVRDHDRLN